jgi:putative methyltransferase (TIGR04325 family)
MIRPHMPSLKRFAVLLLPPIVTDFLRAIRNHHDGGLLQDMKEAVQGFAPEWEAVPETDWMASNGWLHSSIVATQVEKWPDFQASVSAPHSLGVAHEAKPNAPANISSHNIIMTFGYVLGRVISACPETPVHVLDWGGGLGHYAVLAKVLFPETPISYTIMDLPPLIEAGRACVPDAHFMADINDALKTPYDLVYASSSLQYVRDVYGLLARIADTGSRWIMVCRMPFVDESEDFVVVQRPKKYGYDTEYTGWFLNRDKFVKFMQLRGYQLDREFLNDERPQVANAPEQCSYRGFLFKRASG